MGSWFIHEPMGAALTKSSREIMEIFEAYDATGCAWSAARLAGCDAKTVARYVQVRDAGGDPYASVRRPRLIDAHLANVEQQVELSEGAVRADVVHERLVAMGFAGDERSTRRAVAEIKAAWRDGHRRRYRPWVPEIGLWLQFDWGEGPRIGGRRTNLFCAWLAWSRFRVILATWDRTMGTLVSCLDSTLRILGGAPTYLLTDNEKTVTIEHVAGVAVRHPEMVAVGRHYGCVLHTCRPYDPESKGGAESTVKVAKRDLVPTSANLLADYRSFTDLVHACEEVGLGLNARVHRETGRAPVDMLGEERARLHVLPAQAHTAALGETRAVGDDQTIRWGSVRYSTPDGHQGKPVWCRVVGEELVVVARTPAGLAEIARHELSTPGRPQIADAHYPHHPGGNTPRPPRPKARTAEENLFLALGPGAERWLVEAAAVGAQRIRTKMAAAVALAAVVGVAQIDAALMLAAGAGRFDDGALVAITDHLAAAGRPQQTASADETHSAQPGTSAWEAMA